MVVDQKKLGAQPIFKTPFGIQQYELKNQSVEISTFVAKAWKTALN